MDNGPTPGKALSSPVRMLRPFTLTVPHTTLLPWPMAKAVPHALLYNQNACSAFRTLGKLLPGLQTVCQFGNIFQIQAEHRLIKQVIHIPQVTSKGSASLLSQKSCYVSSPRSRTMPRRRRRAPANLAVLRDVLPFQQNVNASGGWDVFHTCDRLSGSFTEVAGRRFRNIWRGDTSSTRHSPTRACSLLVLRQGLPWLATSRHITARS